MRLTEVVILGGGGHAKVVYDLIFELDLAVKAVVTITPTLDPIFAHLEQWNSDDEVLRFQSNSIMLVNGVGSIRVSETRRRIFLFYKQRSYQFHTLIHPFAKVSRFAELNEGAQIMAGSIIQAGCLIGANTIINTKTSVDHDCTIGDHVHIAPGATLSGGVRIGNGSHIGVGATIIQGVSIGCNVTVAAGAVVIRDVVDNALVKGVPAR